MLWNELAHDLFTHPLGARIHTQWVSIVIFPVRLSFNAIENIIGADIYQRTSEFLGSHRKIACAHYINPVSKLGRALAAIHIRHGCSMDNHGGRKTAHAEERILK